MKANTGKVINISTTLHGNHYHHHPVSVLYPSVGRRTVHPAGTGVAGIAAICCLVGANYFTFVWFGLTTGLWLSAASLVACILVGYWMLRSKTLEKYSLHKSIDSTAATQDQLSVQPGDEGVAVTRLALIGNADIGGRLVEVKSADGFLDEGTPVIVVRVEDAQITVKKK